jgi:conjugal transfer pilin signal peptidase TrbI
MNNQLNKNNKAFDFILSRCFFFWVLLPCLLVCFMCWVRTEIGFAINMTESLPQRLFLVRFNQKPKVGDFIVFRGPEHLKIPETLTFTKQVKGKGGDIVTRKERNFFINDHWVGKAKTHSLKGEPLAFGPVGVIPEGQYYVATDHKDSFDSRYQDVGWISISQCIGVAYPLW